MTADTPVDLWRAALEWTWQHPPLTLEPWGRDQARVDELLAELYLLGERPSVHDVRAAVAEIGASEGWAKEVISRWQKRLKRPSWRPRELARSGNEWVRPFYVLEAVAAEYGLRPIPERLADALAIAARDYMSRSVAQPAADDTREAAAVFGLTAGAVRLWSLAQDSVEGGPSWPSVLSFTLIRKDNLGGHWTNAGRARERERLDRWAAERDALEREAADRD